MYTDEGIYVITVSNVYTNQTTTKLIYVGTDDVLKAHVTTGLSIGNIESQLAAGATVAKDGTLIPAPDETLPPIDPTERPATAEPENTPLSSVLPTQNAESHPLRPLVEKSVPFFGFGLLFRCCLSVVRLLSELLSESI